MEALKQLKTEQSQQKSFKNFNTFQSNVSNKENDKKVQFNELRREEENAFKDTVTSKHRTLAATDISNQKYFSGNQEEI